MYSVVFSGGIMLARSKSNRSYLYYTRTIHGPNVYNTWAIHVPYMDYAWTTHVSKRPLHIINLLLAILTVVSVDISHGSVTCSNMQ